MLIVSSDNMIMRRDFIVHSLHDYSVVYCSKTIDCEQLGDGFFPDPTGSFTDVLQYADAIPEVTNISTGYSEAHSAKEIIDADWLITELIPKLYKIDWKGLPVKRDPAKMYSWEIGIYGGYTARSFPWWDDFEDGTQLCDLCAYPVFSDIVQVVELDGYCYHVCPDCLLL